MSLYAPAWTRSDREDLIFRVVRENPFATLVTHTVPPDITYAPILLDESRRVLRGHLALANPVAKHLAAGGRVTVLFHGPHVYVTPRWYSPKTQFVPTWNYVVVHVTGAAVALEGDDYTNAIVELTRNFEDEPPIPLDYLESVRKVLVAFEIPLEEIETKFKLSQNKSPEDQSAVIKELSSRPDDASRQTAEWMRAIRETPQSVD